MHVTRIVTADAEGIDRGTSATEAFLYRRLETLPETAGNFRLNANLPIPFDGRGQMEVDLLCGDLRIAVELDGGQHLNDVEAYRRDRRKDQLLQENGYLVLRFLAEDVGKRLDEVLDAILRSLAHRESGAMNRKTSTGVAGNLPVVPLKAFSKLRHGGATKRRPNHG